LAASAPNLPTDTVTPLLEPARRFCYVLNALADVPDIAVGLADPAAAG
jgi:hypothetical protein